MPSSESAEGIVRRYTGLLTRGDVEGILALFAADAKVFDPVDHAPHSGIQAVREFFREAAKLVDEIRITGPVCVSKNQAHAAAPVHLDVAGRRIEIDAVLAFGFDGSKGITSMQVYWGPDNMRKAPAQE